MDYEIQGMPNDVETRDMFIPTITDLSSVSVFSCKIATNENNSFRLPEVFLKMILEKIPNIPIYTCLYIK